MVAHQLLLWRGEHLRLATAPCGGRVLRAGKHVHRANDEVRTARRTVVRTARQDSDAVQRPLCQMDEVLDVVAPSQVALTGRQCLQVSTGRGGRSIATIVEHDAVAKLTVRSALDDCW
jgi:hypothetical protein